MCFEIDELVYNLISPPDIPSRDFPDDVVFDEILDWADEVSVKKKASVGNVPGVKEAMRALDEIFSPKKLL
jgi:hypothetical protein